MKLAQILVPAFFLFLSGCGGGSGSSGNNDGGTGAATTHGVSMTGSHSFNPMTVTVAAGDTVQWTNTDTAHHTVASDTGVSGMNSDPQYGTGLPGGAKFNWKVPSTAASGTTYFYHCEFHGTAGNGTSFGTGMVGSIVVK